MRILLFAAGLLTGALGFVAFHRWALPSMLQDGLTLGGGWIICALFTYRAKWHGIAGGAMLALLGAARAFPSLAKFPAALAQGGGAPAVQALVALISLVVFVATT